MKLGNSLNNLTNDYEIININCYIYTDTRTKYGQKHRRFIPNILTLTNMFLGFLAIGLILQKEPLKAGN